MAARVPSSHLTRRSVGLAASLGLALTCMAEVKLPAVFGSHMVLQRDREVPVWGWDAPGTEVTVKLGDSSAGVTTDAAGRWQVALPALPAGGPLKLIVTGSSTVTLEDVLVGEVWICSGQSNMEWNLANSTDGEKEVAEAVHLKMRLFQIPKVASPTPQAAVNAAWRDCTPETARGFSAVGYFFGRELLRELQVPVGLINTSWGGTRIEPWTPPAGFASVPKLQGLYERVTLASPSSDAYKQRLSAHLGELHQWLGQARDALAKDELLTPRPDFPRELLPLGGSGDPSALYNGMVHALVPFAIRGAIWYQGESNLADAHLYTYKMQALIQGWRKVWKQGDFPFYWVQLAPFTYGASPRALPRIWEAQEQSLTLPNTGMAVINDIGNLKDIHPRNKLDVGRRLSLIALANTYGRQGLVWSSPKLREFKVEGNRARLRFDHVGAGLKSRDGKPLSWFEIVGRDGAVTRAEAVIDGKDELVVTAPAGTEPVGVRFAWDQTAEPNLANSAGLPAGAFRAGDTEPRNELAAQIPLAKGYQTVYRLDIPEAPGYSDNPVTYAADNRAEMTVPFDRIAYCLELQKANGPLQYVFVSMDAFTKELGKTGVPTVASGAFFQQDVSRLAVASNLAGIPTGEDVGTGCIEFWPSNYGPRNSRPVPGASDEAFDFGDGDARAATKGYGCMQVHLPAQKLTLLAFNRWGPAGACEAGLGNSPQGNPDWTFTNNAAQYSLRRLTVLVRVDK